MFLCNRNICLLLILRLKHVVKEKKHTGKDFVFLPKLKASAKRQLRKLMMMPWALKKAPKCVSYRLT